jgi:hypothetical protein
MPAPRHHVAEPRKITAREHVQCVEIEDPHGRRMYCTPDDAERLAVELVEAARQIRGRRQACSR